MTNYLVDERDIEFSLFEHLQIQNLKNLKIFSHLGEDDYKMLSKEALKFAQRELAPLNEKSDRIGCKLENDKLITPSGYKEIYQAYAANGFIGADVPNTYGGQGLPIALAVHFAEVFMGGCFSFMMFPGLARGAAHLIENFATPELAQKFCPRIYAGEWGGTMCLTEAQAGTAVGDIQTTATPTAEGYLIKGQKIFISCGDNDFTSNVIHMVLARIVGDPAGTKGISLFIVPKVRVNEDGSLGQSNDMKVINIEHKMGIHGSPTCSLSFGDNNQCLGYLVGEARKGMSYMFQLMNEARLMTGMQGLSIGGNAYQHALQYAKERIQGDNNTILQYPDIRRMLATMKAYTEGMRALLYKTGMWIDFAHHETNAERKDYYHGLSELLTPVCKAFCSDTGFKITELAMQTYGGYGYIAEYPIEQMMRDVKISSIYEGTNGVQAMDLLGRKMAKNGGEYFRNFYEHLNEFYENNKTRPTLEKELESFKKALDTVGQCAMNLGAKAMEGDQNFALLNATPFLNMVGYLCFAWLLLEQTLIALPKLEKMWADIGATTEEPKFALCENNPDARYYEGKVKTTRFYIWNLLPQLFALAKCIQNEDVSAMKIRF